MDAGKVRIVVNALREELRARHSAGAQPAGTADDAPVHAVRGADGAHLDSGQAGGGGDGQQRPRARQSTRSGLHVELSSEALRRDVPTTTIVAIPSGMDAPGAEDTMGAAELTQRPIPELVVPFMVPQEPLVAVAPYLVRAIMAAAAATVLMWLLL